MKFLSRVTSAAVLVFAALGAQAATGYCNSGPGGTLSPIQGDGLAVTDFFYRSGAADNCYGVVAGNDNNSPLFDSLFGIDWDHVAKLGGDGSSENGSLGQFNFSITYVGFVGGYHEYVLNASPGTELPAIFDLLGVVKQGGGGKSGGGWSAYFFDDAVVDDTNSGRFRVAFGPGDDAFSHISFYAANPQACERTDPNCGGGGQEIPEPTSLALLGLALAGLGVARRRRAA